MDRRVKATKKDRNGNIVALCNPGESWSPRKKADVLKDISSNKQSYYVQELERRSYVRVVSGDTLQTTTDLASRNSLASLPSV
jgi:hypothetical protein